MQRSLFPVSAFWLGGKEGAAPVVVTLGGYGFVFETPLWALCRDFVAVVYLFVVFFFVTTHYNLLIC